MTTLLTIKREDIKTKLRLLFDAATGKSTNAFTAYYGNYPIANASLDEVNQLLITNGEIPIVLEDGMALIPATLVGLLTDSVVCSRGN